MGIINKLGSYIRKFNRAQAGIAAVEGTDVSPESIVNYQTAYQDVEVINRSIEIIINACCEIPFQIKSGQGPAKKADKLLNERPNPFEDRTRFFRRAFLDFFLDGNTFIYYDREGTTGGALYILPANDVTIIPHPKTFVDHYEYQPMFSQTDDFFGSISASKKNKENNAIVFGPDEIIHIKNDSDQSIYRGDSRLKSLDRLIHLYYSMVTFQRQFFENNAIPGFVLTTDNVLSPKVKNRVLEHWTTNYSNIFKGARSPAILDGGLKIDSFSKVSFRELDFENSVERVQQDLAKALGVPYVLLKSGNNANILNNQTLFYLHTVLPILDQFSSAFSHIFSLDISPDKQSVSALRPDTKSQAMYYSTLVNGGIITPNEARVGLRFEKLDDDKCNCIRVPQNIAGSAVNPSIGGRPDGDGEQ